MYIVFKAYYVYLHFIKRNRIKQNALYREKRVFMIHVSTNDYIIKHATHTIPSLLKCVQLGYNI